jgi:hypothetical protein
MKELFSATIKGVPNIDVDIPTNEASDVWVGLLNGLFFIIGVAAVVTIIIAGFTMTAAGGNPSTIAKAKNMILYSVVGLVVAVLAFTITQFVIGVF